ncbi:MAG: hypothetical protein M3370_03450 [Actinomycetota bacterium]|nr:hypothetical protein [Actinomycetota bacterium]
MSVFVEGEVQASGVITDVGGRLLGRSGVDEGWARVQLDGNGEEVTVSEGDLGQVL